MLISLIVCYVIYYLHMNLLSIYAYSLLLTHCSFGQANSGVGIGRRLSHTIRKTFGKWLVNLSMACIAIYLFCVNDLMVWLWNG